MSFGGGDVLGSVLGDAWSTYLATGGGPSSGSVTSPNGDVVHFDANGLVDYVTPAPRTDQTVEKDPHSQFFGWTLEEENAYWAGGYGAKGISTDLTKAAAVLKNPGDTVTTVDPQVIATSDANLRAIAQTNPKVAAAIAALAAGSNNAGGIAAADARADAINAAATATDKAAWDAVLPGYWDAAIASGQHPNSLSLSDAVTQGILTQQQAAHVATVITANQTGSTPPPAPPVPVVTLQNGKFVDDKGQSVSSTTLVQLGIQKPAPPPAPTTIATIPPTSRSQLLTDGSSSSALPIALGLGVLAFVFLGRH